MKILQIFRFITGHPLTQKAPWRGLWRFLIWQIRSRSKKTVTFNWIEGTKLLVQNGMTGATGNIYCGLHEYADMSFILHALREGDLFIDVGSNIGSYTILASGVCRAETIAIEPDPDTANHLRANIAANRLEDLVRVVETAVGAENGEIKFTMGEDTTNQVATQDNGPVRTVPLATLDHIIGNRNPVVIKMDVEGYETETLLGAARTLANPSLIAIEIETADPEGIRILTHHGFRRVAYAPTTRSLEPSELAESSNALFVRDEIDVLSRIQTAPTRKYRNDTV